MSNLRLRAIATALLSAGTLLAGPVASAEAAPVDPAPISVAPEINWYHGAAPTPDCAAQRGALCAYWDKDFGGTQTAYFKLNNKNWRETDNAWINDKSSSWYNNGIAGTYDSVVIYQDKDWPADGLKVCIDRGWGIKYHSTLNDQVSSNKWVAGPC